MSQKPNLLGTEQSFLNIKLFVILLWGKTGSMSDNDLVTTNKRAMREIEQQLTNYRQLASDILQETRSWRLAAAEASGRLADCFHQHLMSAPG